MFNMLGGRKMIAATLTIGVGLLTVALKGDVPPNLLQLLEVVFGVFAGANAINTASGMSLEKRKVQVETLVAQAPQAPVAPQGIPPEAAIEAFQAMSAGLEAHGAKTHQMLEGIIKSTQVTQQALSMVAEKVLSR